jgi:heterodisulfide reductase subunit C1
VRDVSHNLDLWRRALPPETLHTTTTAWEIDDKTLVELYLIWHMTGVLDMIKAVDEGLHMILNDVMEELLEDHDIVV